jgi:hypothetical protein
MNNDDEIKIDDSPLSKLRNLRPIMYPIFDEAGNVKGYDYGVDVQSVEGMFPWMIQKDSLGRSTLNKDSMIFFLLACILEQDKDVETLYQETSGRIPRTIQPWTPDAQ